MRDDVKQQRRTGARARVDGGDAPPSSSAAGRCTGAGHRLEPESPQKLQPTLEGLDWFAQIV